MANPMEMMQRALGVRLALQVSLSQLPVVEESMDIDFSRWLDHVPLPPELPGGTANFGVTIGSDLSRVCWDAYGLPRGFIPKLSKYFDKCVATPADIEILNQVGGALEPNLMGSWISVESGTVQTGWQFRQHLPVSQLEPHLGAGPSTAKLVGWLSLSKIETFTRFTQAINIPTSDIEFALPGDTAAAQVAVARTGFMQMFGEELPDYIQDAATAAGDATVSFAVRISGEVLSRVSLIMPFAGNDVIAGMCKAASIPYDDALGNIQKSLQSNGAKRVEFRMEDDLRKVDVQIEPGSAERPRAATN